jgi:hypothetical protein
MAQAADELNRAGSLQAQIGVAESALVAFINTLYATDTDQQPANYDAETGRILIPTPWGSNGWRHWGLRKTEAIYLRKVLMARAMIRKPAPLFCHNQDSKQWFLNNETYPTTDAALLWLKHNGPQLGEWRTIALAHRLADAERKHASRMLSRQATGRRPGR